MSQAEPLGRILPKPSPAESARLMRGYGLAMGSQTAKSKSKQMIRDENKIREPTARLTKLGVTVIFNY